MSDILPSSSPKPTILSSPSRDTLTKITPLSPITIDPATSFRLQALPWNSQNSIQSTGGRPSPRLTSTSPRPVSSPLRSTASFYAVPSDDKGSPSASRIDSFKATYGVKSPTLASTTPKTIIADAAASSSSSSSSSSSAHLTLENVLAERDTLHQTLARVKEALEETNIRLTATSSQLMVARSEADAALKDCNAARKVAKTTEEEHQHLRKQYDNALSEITELRGSTAALASSLSKMSEGRAQAIAERDAIHSTLKNLRTVERRLVIVLAVRCQAFRIQIQDLRKSITDLNHSISVLTGERDALRRQVHTNVDQKKLSTLEKQLQESKEREEALRNTVTSLSAQLESSRSACAEAELRQTKSDDRIRELSRIERRLVIILAMRVAALRHHIEQGKQDKLETTIDADSAKHTLRAKLSAEHRLVEKLTMELSRAQAERDEAKATVVKLSLEMGSKK